MDYAKVVSGEGQISCFCPSVVGEYALITAMTGEMGTNQINKVADAAYKQMEVPHAA